MEGRGGLGAPAVPERPVPRAAGPVASVGRRTAAGRAPTRLPQGRSGWTEEASKSEEGLTCDAFVTQNGVKGQFPGSFCTSQ